MTALRENQRALREVFPYKNVIVTPDAIVVSWDIVRLNGVLTEAIPNPWKGQVIDNHIDTREQLTGGLATGMCVSIKRMIEKRRKELPPELRDLPVTVRGI